MCTYLMLCTFYRSKRKCIANLIGQAWQGTRAVVKVLHWKWKGDEKDDVMMTSKDDEMMTLKYGVILLGNS